MNKNKETYIEKCATDLFNAKEALRAARKPVAEPWKQQHRPEDRLAREIAIAKADALVVEAEQRLKAAKQMTDAEVEDLLTNLNS